MGATSPRTTPSAVSEPFSHVTVRGGASIVTSCGSRRIQLSQGGKSDGVGRGDEGGGENRDAAGASCDEVVTSSFKSVSREQREDRASSATTTTKIIRRHEDPILLVFISAGAAASREMLYRSTPYLLPRPRPPMSGEITAYT